VLHQRGALWWYPPLDLNRLSNVRMSGWTSKFPHRELEFGSDDGKTRSIAPIWWSNWRPLVTMLAASASSSSIEDPSHRVWKFTLDSKTERFLRGYLKTHA
jgi:hypothetical protein